MTKIRIFHKAFENEISHVATMKMPTNKNIDETLEYVFKRTQNFNEAWITENVGFNMLPTITPQIYNEISILKDNELAQYFFNCNINKDIDIKSIKETKIKLDHVA